jgi:hypothetical protein
MSEYAPGTYVKNGRTRVARSAREAVALVFEGYKPDVVDAPAPAPVEETPTPAPAPEESKTVESFGEVAPTPKPQPPIKKKD